MVGDWPVLPGNKLFPTLVIGSLPRDEWVVDVINARNSGRADGEHADLLLDEAVLYAIRMQEQAGLDFVSDGEWRRNTYLRVFTDAVDGFELDAIPSGSFSTSPLPAVMSKIEQRQPLSVDAAKFLNENARVRTIAALPSPYTIGGKMWSAKHSKAVYGTSEELMEACIPIVNKEIKALAALGIDVVHITRSSDNGLHWTPPKVLAAYPGWDVCGTMGQYADGVMPDDEPFLWARLQLYRWVPNPPDDQDYRDYKTFWTVSYDNEHN